MEGLDFPTGVDFTLFILVLLVLCCVLLRFLPLQDSFQSPSGSPVL